MARKHAARLGLTLRQQADVFRLHDEAGQVFLGCLVAVETWLAAQQVNRPPGPAPTVTFPGAWEPWMGLFVAELRAARRRPKTIGLRIYHLAQFARTHPDPLTVTRDELAHHLGDQEWSAAYAHSVRASLRVFFGFLHTHGHRGDNPAATLLPVKVPRSKPRPCPDHAIRAALESGSDRARLAIRLGAEAGLRRAEIAALRTTDVLGSPGGYYLHVTGKGGHERQVPISDGLAAALLASPMRCVFPRWDNTPIQPDSLGKLVSRALPDHWAPHSLRHRFATTAYQATRDLRAVQELLGHTSPTTTAIYTAVADDSLRFAAAAAVLE